MRRSAPGLVCGWGRKPNPCFVWNFCGRCCASLSATERRTTSNAATGA